MEEIKKRPGPRSDCVRTLRLDLQYEGTNYVGWQRQAKGESVQGILEEVLREIAGERVTLFSSGRTDAGVHANHQVVSFSLTKPRPPAQAFLHRANHLLPSDIRIFQAQEVDRMFHANAEAKEKTYRYFLYLDSRPNLFFRKFSWHIFLPLDWEKIQEASSLFLGTHDFSAFRSYKQETKTSVRTVHRVNWNLDLRPLVYFEVSANGFLHHMVRNLVGLLVDVGLGKKNVEEVKSILLSKKREEGASRAPSNGLFLWHVVY